MRTRTLRPPAVLTGLLLFLLSGGACVPAKVRVETFPVVAQVPLKTVAVLPFSALSTPQIISPQASEPSVPAGVKRSDITLAVPPVSERLDQPTETVPPQAAETVTRLFYRKLKAREDLSIIPPEEAQAALEQLGIRRGEMISREASRQVAARLKADAVLVGQVSVYREREGSKLGANPAVVGFEVGLIGADGSTLWKGDYYERQRPMIEDFLGFVQRWGFVTAEELADYGADGLIRNFPAPTPDKTAK